jgi:hypothetical protein
MDLGSIRRRTSGIEFEVANLVGAGSIHRSLIGGGLRRIWQRLLPVALKSMGTRWRLLVGSLQSHWTATVTGSARLRERPTSGEPYEGRGGADGRLRISIMAGGGARHLGSTRGNGDVFFSCIFREGKGVVVGQNGKPSC